MDVTGANVERCAHCAGLGNAWTTDPDADGCRVLVDCEGCDGAGRVVVCAEPLCGERIPYGEAAREGVFCAACRVSLDRRDQVDETARIRRTA